MRYREWHPERLLEWNLSECVSRAVHSGERGCYRSNRKNYRIDRIELRKKKCFRSSFFFVGRSEGDGAVFFISKNLPLKGKFFEMVSWGGLGGLAPPGISVTRALPPGGVWGAWPPQESPLITRASPPQRPCLAPDFFRNFFVQIFSEFFRRNFFRTSVRPSRRLGTKNEGHE